MEVFVQDGNVVMKDFLLAVVAGWTAVPAERTTRGLDEELLDGSHWVIALATSKAGQV